MDRLEIYSTTGGENCKMQITKERHPQFYNFRDKTDLGSKIKLIEGRTLQGSGVRGGCGGAQWMGGGASSE